jgi:hypothetical protein
LAEAAKLATPRPVFLVIGGAKELDRAHEDELLHLFEWGLVRAAGSLGATLMDGGTQSGVMAVLGRAAAASDTPAPLVGVAPAGKVTFPGDDDRRARGDQALDPNHTAFVLAASDRYGGETPLLFDLARVVAGSESIIAILAGGGEGALEEVRLAVHQRIPIVVIAGSGGEADKLAAAIQSTVEPGTDDPYAEFRARGDLTFVKLDTQPEAFARILGRFLALDETLRGPCSWR